MGLLGGGAGVVLGGFGLVALALALAAWLALRRPRRPAVPDGPLQGASVAAAACAARRVAVAGVSRGSWPARGQGASPPSLAEDADGIPSEQPSRPPSGSASQPSAAVQAEIAAHLRRLAEARTARLRRSGTMATDAVPPGAATTAGGAVVGPSAGSTPSVGSVAVPPGRAPVVLVVDDARIVRVRLSQLLGPLGWTVLEAADGQSALEGLVNAAPDLLITDVAMPGLDGFALIRAIRADPALARLPVIMISGDDDRHREEAARAGVSVLLGKPFGEAALVAHVRRLVPGLAGTARPAASAVAALPRAMAGVHSSLVGAGR